MFFCKCRLATQKVSSTFVLESLETKMENRQKRRQVIAVLNCFLVKIDIRQKNWFNFRHCLSFRRYHDKKSCTLAKNYMICKFPNIEKPDSNLEML